VGDMGKVRIRIGNMLGYGIWDHGVTGFLGWI
jgi:hypothetical protein